MTPSLLCAAGAGLKRYKLFPGGEPVEQIMAAGNFHYPVAEPASCAGYVSVGDVAVVFPEQFLPRGLEDYVIVPNDCSVPGEGVAEEKVLPYCKEFFLCLFLSLFLCGIQSGSGRLLVGGDKARNTELRAAEVAHHNNQAVGNILRE